VTPASEKLLVLAGLASLVGLGVYVIYEAAASANPATTPPATPCAGTLYTFAPEEYGTSPTLTSTQNLNVGDCLELNLTGVRNISISGVVTLAGPLTPSKRLVTYRAVSAGVTTFTFVIGSGQAVTLIVNVTATVATTTAPATS